MYFFCKPFRHIDYQTSPVNADHLNELSMPKQASTATSGDPADSRLVLLDRQPLMSHGHTTVSGVPPFNARILGVFSHKLSQCSPASRAGADLSGAAEPWADHLSRCASGRSMASVAESDPSSAAHPERRMAGGWSRPGPLHCWMEGHEGALGHFAP
jgi:hypothetical protein